MTNAQNMIKLYSYWRSSASWRVRILLAHLQIPYELIEVNLLEGEHLKSPFEEINPNGLVPVLQLEDGTCLTQSIAIMDYLQGQKLCATEFWQPTRSVVYEIMFLICCDIHPVQNLRVAKHIVPLGGDKEEWIREWITKGFQALEKILEKSAGTYCVGDEITMADMCLIPQHYNAIRYGCDMIQFPCISGIVANANKMPQFYETRPIEPK